MNPKVRVEVNARRRSFVFFQGSRFEIFSIISILADQSLRGFVSNLIELLLVDGDICPP